MKKFKSIKRLVQRASCPANYSQTKIALEEIKAAYLKLEHQSIEKLIVALEETEAHLVSVLAQPNLYQWQRSFNERELFGLRAEINRLKASAIKIEIKTTNTTASDEDERN